jgi:hypothetical protein
MMECMKSMAKKPKGERIKVSDLEIIVTMMDKDPYYEIKYKKIGENHYNVGYSSYKLENVLAWRDECFEVVEKPQTNADRIRSMTDEELAEVLFGSCIEHMGVEECSHPEEACKSCVLDWLRAESEE